MGILGTLTVAVVGFAFGSVLATATEPDPAQADVVVSPAAAGVYECPGGTLAGEYQRGSRVFAVGRTEDANWIEVRDLDAPGKTVWMSTGVLAEDSPFEQLPVTECHAGVSVIVVSATTTTTADQNADESTTTVDQTTTTIQSTTTTTVRSTTTTTVQATTTTQAGTTTTEAPDTIPPKASTPTVDENKIWEEDTNSLSCGDLPRESVVSIIASDEQSGIASVRASWTIGGSPGSVNMVLSGSTYTGVFGPFPYLTIPDGTDQIVTITVTVRDNAGNQTTGQVGVRVHSLGTCFG